MGNEIKPSGGGIGGWLKGAFWGVAKSGAATEAWKVAAPVVLPVIGGAATYFAAYWAQAPLALAFTLAAVTFAGIMIGVVKWQALNAKRHEANKTPEPPAPKKAGLSLEEHAAISSHILNAYTAFGAAVESDSRYYYEEAVATVEPILMMLQDAEIPVPEVRKDGAKLGTLRAHRFLNLTRASLLRGDSDGVARRANEHVPLINAMTEPELLAHFEGIIAPKDGAILPAKGPIVRHLNPMEIEVIEARRRAAKPALERDMSFKDALRHFAYKSRWAQEYRHPPSATLVAEFWPQTVHRVFCQSLIDGDVVAWGVRREDGKAPENGSTKIPADFWRTGQFDVHNTLESPDMLGWARDWNKGISYSRVMFNSMQVKDTWPAADESAPVSVIEIAAREWWRLRQIDVALSQEQMAEQVERTEEARRAAAEKMADPYREAVLRLEDVKVTKMSNGEYLTKVECHLRLTSRVMLLKCCAWISTLQGHETIPIEAFCRTGRNRDKTFKTGFALAAGHIQPLALIKRDLADIVSNPPFLLLTDKGEYPLEDNSEYHLHLELRSEAKYPTLVDLKIVTGVKDVLDVSITNQAV